MDIIINNIKKSYGDVKVLESISLTFKSNEITTLLGSSGSGKTTLLRIIAGLEDPDDGEIYFGDKLIYSKEKSINVETSKRNLGFVFQDFALWPHLTVLENIVYGLKVKNDKDYYNKGIEAIRKVNIKGLENRYPHELSGGQQQRVSLARALCTKPIAILLDEPFSALDHGLRLKMREEVKELIEKNNITAIFVTHDQEEALTMSDNIVLLNNGEVEQEGTPINLYENPKTKVVFNFMGKGNLIGENKGIRPQFIDVNADGNGLKAKVISSLYSGEKYENKILVDGNIWRIYTENQLEVDSFIYLNFKEDKVISFI